ncbi:MAG TPA: YHYH protein, partial [Tepidisphaeraceae bacterium]|nr:YHYH protein [Tepidisphaeraceae bacterium]
MNLAKFKTLAAIIALFFTGVSWANLVKNSRFDEAGPGEHTPANYAIGGDVEYRYLADPQRAVADWGVVFESGPDAIDHGNRQGFVTQTVTSIDAHAGRWFRFTFRGLPQDHFSVSPDGLFMKVEYFTGNAPDDGKVKPIYWLVQQQRRDLSINGDYHHGGAASWHTYQLDFMLPSSQVNRLRLTVGFDHGNATQTDQSEFFVTDFSLTRIDGPEPTEVGNPHAVEERPANLIAIGGRWFYKTAPGESSIPKVFDYKNSNRLIYHDNRWSAPFEGSMSSYLRPGEKDFDGNIVTKDKFVPDNVTVSFDATSMIIHTKGIPNHPTGKFPQSHGNPNYIQEQDNTFYIPLNPKENPDHVAVNANDENRALPMGPIGVAINGVVFFNPFDAGMGDASNYMDYCCGHPNEDNLYHYHKYPICINSPWADEGKEHSPLIGWAFDGFPIYGPYVKAGLMAKDAQGDDGLNAFNIHYDSQRGWHYQVTPGKFPYVIGGFWGSEDPRDHQRPRHPRGWTP